MNPATRRCFASLLLLTLLAACGGAGTTGTEATSTDARASGAAGRADDEHSGDEHVTGVRSEIVLDRAQIERAGIHVEAATAAEIRETLPLYGAIVPNAERMREVSARFPGVIRTVNTRVGDAVRLGATLATIESNESLETYPLVAPLAGVITARNANPGEQTGERVLFTVADLATVWVELSLFPRDIPRVRVGQEVRVRKAETDEETSGRVVYVSPFGSSSTQTLTARVQIDNVDRAWPPGLYVTAAVTLARRAVPVAVKSTALQTLDDATVVFVRTTKGFAPRPVRVGADDGGHAEILEGLAAGESYAAAQSFILKAEAGKGAAGHEH